MRTALGDHLLIEVGKLLQKPNVLEQHRPTGPAVVMVWLSTTGAPPFVVSFLFSMMPLSSSGLAVA